MSESESAILNSIVAEEEEEGEEAGTAPANSKQAPGVDFSVSFTVLQPDSWVRCQTSRPKQQSAHLSSRDHQQSWYWLEGGQGTAACKTCETLFVSATTKMWIA